MEDEDTSERNVLDIMRMNTSGGLLTAENTTIAAMDVASLTVPGGTYLVEAGHLALGGPGDGMSAYQKGVIGQTFPDSLAANNINPIELLWPSLRLSFSQCRRISDVGWPRPKPSIGGRGIFQFGG